MITPEAMREMIERLEDGTKLSSVVNARAAAMLRSIAAEREAAEQEGKAITAKLEAAYGPNLVELRKIVSRVTE